MVEVRVFFRRIKCYPQWTEGGRKLWIHHGDRQLTISIQHHQAIRTFIMVQTASFADTKITVPGFGYVGSQGQAIQLF